MINLIKNDMQITFTSQWKKFLPIVLIAILGCLYMLFDEGRESGFLDYLIFFFKGIEPFVIIDANTVFKIPFIWLCLHLYIFYLIADYPISDLKMTGKDTLIRIGDRRIWWASKSITTIITVFISYALLTITILAFTLVTGGNLFKVTAIYEINFTDLMVATIVLPMVLTCCVGLFQLSLSLLTRSIISFLGVVALMVISAYFMNPFLFGNYMMLLRNQLLLSEGVLTIYGFILAAAIGLAGYIIGHFTIKKMNIY